MNNQSDILKRLGQGDSIDQVCKTAGISRTQFDAWWGEECRRRVPATNGNKKIKGLHGSVRITRDRWGIPHIQAGNDLDLFFGFGYATAQDRLFQLDFLRRKGHGQLAEILGPDGVENDVLVRTIGLSQIAEREWAALPKETQDLLAAYTAGINAWLEASRSCLPIEFDLLDYQPQPWSPCDSLAIAGEFRWYLTGRFPVIVIPELAKRTLGAGALYQAFLPGEVDEESMLLQGEYPAAKGGPKQVGPSSGVAEGPGSNNWVLAGKRTTTGKPIVASDPHVLHGAVSIWHEVHLQGSSFNVAGVALAGFPGVMIGRNEKVAWGVTNNICSLRDLYQEKTDPAHPGCFLYDGDWEPAQEREEIIQVRGSSPLRQIIRSSHHGPIVDHVLPPAARQTGPVSLRWLGVERCGWLTALLGMNRARSCREFREATRPWLVPTFNLVFADVDGHIGYQCVGRIPIRQVAERGYRPGWDPRHQWQGLLVFDKMPHLLDPERGFVVTANNRVAPDDFAYPLSGTWATGYRARRIREQLESRPRWSREDCRLLQLDIYSGRPAAAVPHLLAVLGNDKDPRVQQALQCFQGWDYRVTADSIAAAIFNVFFAHWCRVVTEERFPAAQVALVSGNASGLAMRLLADDKPGWFVKKSRPQAIKEALLAALDELTSRLGPDLKQWRWGTLHALQQKHFLSGRGDLGQLLDRSGLPTPGDATTVFNGGTDANFASYLGATYRMVTDLADAQQGLWAVEVASTSGHPGSPHYDDQLQPWHEGSLHFLPLQGDAKGTSCLTLEPAD